MTNFSLTIEYNVADSLGTAGQQPYQPNATYDSITNLTLTDKLNELKKLEFDIPNDAYHRANSYVERTITANFISKFRGVITGRQLNQATIHLIATEFAWHFQRRIFRTPVGGLPRTSYTQVATNLESYWQFEQNLNDTQGHLNLTLASGSPTYVGGIDVNGAYALQSDGNTSLTGSDSIFSSGNTDRTVVFWIKPGSLSVDQAIFSYGTAVVNEAFGAILEASGKILFYGWTNDVTSTGTLSVGNWYHIALCLGVHGTLRKIYINGVQDSSFNTAALNTVLSGTFQICSDISGTSKMLNQTQIDGFRVYNNRMLTSVEVAQLFANTLPPSNATLKEVTTGDNIITDILASANNDMPSGVTWVPMPPNIWRKIQYHFDTADAIDTSGNKNNSIITPGCTFPTGQNTGSLACKFNNLTDVVTPLASINITQLDYSIMAWIGFPSSNATGTYIAVVRGATDIHLAIRVSDGHVGSLVGGTFYDSGYTISTVSNNWHFLGCVASNSLNQTTFYLDGVQIGNPVSIKSNDAITMIGGDGTNQSLMTTLDDIQIWTRMLQTTEINDLFAGEEVDPFVYPEVAIDFNYLDHYTCFQNLSLAMGVDLWFDSVNYIVYFGVKGKTLDQTLDIQVNTNPTTSTDNYANILNMLGKPTGTNSQLELQVTQSSDLLYNYEKVIADTTMSTKDMMSNIGNALLAEFGNATPFVEGNILFTEFVNYDLNTGDIVILSLPDREIVGTYRVTSISVDQTNADVSLESTANGTFRTRSQGLADIVSAMITRIMQGQVIQ